MGGRFGNIRRWSTPLGRLNVCSQSDLAQLSAETILFYSSVEIDEIWTRTTALACRKFGMRIAAAIIGSRAGVEALAPRYLRQGIPVYRLNGTAALRTAGVRTVVTASSGVARSLFTDRLEHLIHMPHSLISLHMGYPPNAFDDYDLLFAAGPHHVVEFAALRKVRGLNGALALPVGYGKLDILEEGLERLRRLGGPVHVLVAPSWGPTNLLNVMGKDLVVCLMERDMQVTVRPHPSFYDNEPEALGQLRLAGGSSPRFQLENPSAENRAIYDADVLISDYSGTALEFAALNRRPVIFVDVAKKIFNPNWQDLGLPAMEVEVRSSLGRIVPSDAATAAEAVEEVVRDQRIWSQSIVEAEGRFLFRSGRCGDAAAKQIRDLH